MYDKYASEILYPHLAKMESSRKLQMIFMTSWKTARVHKKSHNEDIIFITSLDDILIDQADIAYM